MTTMESAQNMSSHYSPHALPNRTEANQSLLFYKMSFPFIGCPLMTKPVEYALLVLHKTIMMGKIIVFICGFLAVS